MSVPLDLPGLDAHAPDVPDGRLVLLEGGPDPAKSTLARRIALKAAALGRPVRVLSTSGRPGPGAADLHVEEVDDWPQAWPEADVVVDSFSLLCLDASPAEVARRLRAVREGIGRTGRVVVLVVDDGQFSQATAAVAHHLADGILQFQSREDADGPVRFIRIPKWMGKPGASKNLYYGQEGDDILIDTRRRVT